MVGEAVQLNLRKLFDSQGNIVAQLAQRQQAAVGDELRRIETAAEHPPAIAALLRHQERREGILPIDGGQHGEAREQRLHPRQRQFHLGEIDPAIGARGELVAVLRAAHALDALAEHEVGLVDAAELVGGVGVGPSRKPRILSSVLGGT